LPTLVYAALKRIGRLKEAEIPQLGQTIESLAVEFELPPHVDRNLLTEADAAKLKV
jgi:hypothetical protein